MPHRSGDHANDEVPVLSWDYAFLRPFGQEPGAHSDPDQAGHSPVLSIRDRSSQTCLWYLIPRMGTDFVLLENLVACIVRD